MSTKKRHHDLTGAEPPPGEETHPPSDEEVGRADNQITAPEIEQLTQLLEQAEARAAENLDGWQRSQAEFQNYRKRLERDSELTQVSMKADILRQVLPVLDDLERALQNRPSDSGPWVSGIELIHRKLKSMLEAQGLRRIMAEGAPFDPLLHEAISHEPAESVESGHVIAVTQNGYMLGDKVIRPASVRVAQ